MKAVRLALSSSCISTALSWRTHGISGQVLSSQNMLSRDLGSRVLTGAAAPAERLSSPRTVKYYIHSRSFGVMVLMLGAFTQHPGKGERQQTQRACRITHCLSEKGHARMQSPHRLHSSLFITLLITLVSSPCADRRDCSLVFLVNVPLLTLLLVQNALPASCPFAFPNLNLFFVCLKKNTRSPLVPTPYSLQVSWPLTSASQGVRHLT